MIPAILYYLRVGSKLAPLYKIGITNRTVEERYNSAYDLSQIATLKTWDYQTGSEAHAMEQQIIHEFAEFKYSGRNVLERVGTSKMFTHDILQLDGP